MTFDLDGVRMNATTTAPNGVVNGDTVFEFEQHGSVVEARYAGGRVTHGRLIGEIDGDRLRFVYAQRHDDGSLASGRSDCTIDRTGDGGLRITERFEWDAGAGVNVFEELR